MQTQQPATTEPRIVSVNKAAELLGSVHENFVWKRLREGTLHRVKLGTRTLVTLESINALIDAGRQGKAA